RKNSSAGPSNAPPRNHKWRMPLACEQIARLRRALREKRRTVRHPKRKLNRPANAVRRESAKKHPMIYGLTKDDIAKLSEEEQELIARIALDQARQEREIRKIAKRYRSGFWNAFLATVLFV